MTAPPLIRIRQLRHGWPGLALFERLDIDILPGITLVTGDESCGKSTLLRLLAGREQALAGLFEHSAPAFLSGILDPAHDATPVQELLADVPDRLVQGFGLVEHRPKPLYMLSAGSRRKVGLCQTLASPAPVLLIDQPVAALDPPSIRFLADCVHRMAREPGRAVVLADYQAPPGITPDHTIVLPDR